MANTAVERARVKRVNAILADMIQSSENTIVAAAAMTMDGYVVSSMLSPGTDEDRFSAMCASLLALANTTTDEIKIGDMRQIMIMGSQGVLLLHQAGDSTVLAISALSKANLGKILMVSRNTASSIEAAMISGQ